MSTSLLIAICVLAFLTSMTFVIKWSLRKDEREIKENSYVILYNRRLRQLKEVHEKEYKPSASWEKIAITYGSNFDYFIKWLKSRSILNKNGTYVDIASTGAEKLKSLFKKFLNETT